MLQQLITLDAAPAAAGGGMSGILIGKNPVTVIFLPFMPSLLPHRSARLQQRDIQNLYKCNNPVGL